MTKPRKIGSSTLIASFMPRRFRQISTTMTPISTSSLHVVHAPSGRKLNSASTPLAIEMAMVST